MRSGFTKADVFNPKKRKRVDNDDASSSKSKKTTKATKSQPALETEPLPPWEPTGLFPFLDLPRELQARDLARHFDIPFHFDGGWNPPFPPLYEGTLWGKYQVLEHDWDIEQIQRLVMMFDLTRAKAYIYDHTYRHFFNPLEHCVPIYGVKEPPLTMKRASYRALHYMPKLKELHVLFYYYEEVTYSPLREFFKGMSTEAPRELVAMMKSLITAAPKSTTIRWGATEKELDDIVPHTSNVAKRDYVGEEVSKALADGFEALERTDPDVFPKGCGFGHNESEFVGESEDEKYSSRVAEPVTTRVLRSRKSTQG
ncbi:uncharacterized protein BDZ99DRAFT_570562 [Mytilinidion resinicola]|uniref:Uncharacterized protein n=1 Tax=Mytilinidion resinicola TaxID=574789 RepID=A0A6A6YPL9_9PEZI|nr:uncharacterized protein BDZ99DRAFT_570562 [Mytilinidion resinicola]KAF2809925.1 hypothetical protein BDZ99DRAFT_570562 [Mytilinidion resinicola]